MRIVNGLLLLWCSSAATIASEAMETYVTDTNRYQFKSEKVHKQKLNEEQLNLLGFVLGKDSLQNVMEKLGAAKVLPRREQAPTRICYTSDKNVDGTAVVFAAGPLGGWKKLTSITVFSKEANFGQRDLCTISSLVTRKIGTRGGLKLGIGIREMKTILGEPTYEQDRNVLYVYRAEEKMTQQQIEKMAKLWPKVKEHPYMDVSSDVEGTFLGSKLVSFTVSRIESY